MAITFHFLNLRDQASDIETIKRIKDMGVYIIGAEPYDYAKEYCDLVIDPQHNSEFQDISATKFTYLNVFAEIPWDIAVFIGKVDLDAVATAALILDSYYDCWYTLQEKFTGDLNLDDKFEDRINLIDIADRGLWARDLDWAPHKPLTEEEFIAKANQDPLLPLHNWVRKPVKHSEDIREIVTGVLKWLLTGEEPEGYREKGIQDKLAAFNASKVIRVENNIAVIESTHFGAVQNVGYLFAPYVIAYNPSFTANGKVEPHLKYTIARVSDKYLWQHESMTDALNEAEKAKGDLTPGWGVRLNPGIKGSKQGYGSLLTPDEVFEIVKAHIA